MTITKINNILIKAVILIIILNSISNCGIEHAGPTQSILLDRMEETEEINKEYINKRRRNLQSACQTCLKIKFDFNVLDTHLDYVDFRDSEIVKAQTDVITRLKYVFDESSDNRLIINALNSLVKTEKSLFDLSEKDCYEKGYVLSDLTLVNQVDYDLFIIPVIDTVNLGCESQKDKMWVKYCFQDLNTRKPIFALMGFSPYFETGTSLTTWKNELSLGQKSVKFNKLFNRILHQIIHLLGFHLDLFGQFINASGQKVNMLSETDFRMDQINSILRKDINNRSSDYIYSHKALEHSKIKDAAQAFYNCANSSIKIPLENSGGPTVAHMHWESALMLGELMTADPDFEDIYISPLTTAFLYATGWYKSKYPDGSGMDLHGGKYVFGKGMGCDFLRGNFFSNDSPKFHHFCNQTGKEGCTPNLSGIGTCNLKSSCSDGSCNENMCLRPKDLHYIFSDRTVAGDYCYNDHIPFYKPNFTGIPSKHCRSPLGNNSNTPLKTFFSDYATVNYSSNGQACFYHNIVENKSVDNTSASTTVLNYEINPSCFNYKCEGSVLKVCLTDNNSDCYPCVNFTKADGQVISQAFVKVSNVVNSKLFEGYIICPSPDQLCTSYCKSIYECIFATYTPEDNTLVKLENKVTLFLEAGFNQCCACCSTVSSTTKKAKHCLGDKWASTSCPNAENCCGSLTPGKSENCSRHEYCMSNSYYTDFSLKCCGNGVTENCSTFSTCLTPTVNYPCGNPFNFLHTSSYGTCAFQRPLCDVTLDWIPKNSNCIDKSESIFGFTLPLMRKCDTRILTNCNERGNIYIDNVTRLIPPCDPTKTEDLSTCYSKTLDEFDLKKMTDFKLPKCIQSRKSNLLISGETIYVCMLLKEDDVGLKNMFEPEDGFEYLSSKGTLCNNSLFSNCITSEYFLNINTSKFNLSSNYFLPCDGTRLVDCVAPLTDELNINKYSIFTPSFCCPSSNSDFYKSFSPVLCKVCTGEVNGITMPFFRACKNNSTKFCLKVPSEFPLNTNEIYEFDEKAPHEKFNMCFATAGSGVNSNCTAIPADITTDVKTEYFIYCNTPPTVPVTPPARALGIFGGGGGGGGGDSGCDPNASGSNCPPPCNPDIDPTCPGYIPRVKCDTYVKNEKCCGSESPLLGPPLCKFVNCVREIKKCKINPPTLEESDFCQYVPDTLPIGKCDTKLTNTLFSYTTDVVDTYWEMCTDARPLLKYCCPKFLDQNLQYYKNSSACDSTTKFCVKYVLPCCNASLNITNDCIKHDENYICFDFSVDFTVKFLPACNTGVLYADITDINLFCIHNSDPSKMISISYPSVELNTLELNNKNFNNPDHGKKLICCDKENTPESRKNNCFYPIEAHRENYCKMIPHERVPICSSRSRGLGINLNCNNKITTSVTTAYSAKFPCCDPGYNFPNSCATYANCVILPCCNKKDVDGKYTLYEHSVGNVSSNCTKPNSIPPLFPTNCHIIRPCCTTKFTSNEADCSTSPICFPYLERCETTLPVVSLTNCIRFSFAKPANEFVRVNSNWCELDNESCNNPDKHNCKVLSSENTFDTIISNINANKDNYITNSTLSSRYCFVSRYYTFVPPNCPKTYDEATRVESCIYNYSPALNNKSQFCCETADQSTCYNAPKTVNIALSNNHCIPNPPKVNCCLPISNLQKTIEIQSKCSFLNSCVSNFFQPCCNQLLITGCNNNRNGGCISENIRCNNNYNILGKCHNLGNSYLPSPCSSDNSEYCVPPLRCCDTYTISDCSNLPNCLKPLPTCDVNRGKGSHEFSISDEIPCIKTINGKKVPLGLPSTSPYFSVFNIKNGEYITTPAEFELKPCCSTTETVIGCVNDTNYCIPQMKCCYKILVDKLFFETKKYVFTNKCTNLANCHEAGPCRCMASDPFSENCKSVFNVPALNDASNYCYAALPYCYEINKNTLFSYNCCDLKNNKTNCVLYGMCNNIEISNYEFIPQCSSTLSPKVKDFCIQAFDFTYLINFNCCSEIITENCVVHSSCLDVYSLPLCVNGNTTGPCYKGKSMTARNVCCTDDKGVELATDDCIVDKTANGACRTFLINELEPCTDSVTTNCYKGNYIASFVKCTLTITTNCIRTSNQIFTVALFKILKECSAVITTDCFVSSSIEKRHMVDKICCTATNSINCIKTDYCTYPDMTKSDVITRVCVGENDNNCLRGKFVVGNYNCCSARFTYDCIKIDNCENGIDLLRYKALIRCTGNITNNCFIAVPSKSKYDILIPNCCNSRYTDNCIIHDFCRQPNILNINDCGVGEVKNCYKGSITNYACVTTAQASGNTVKNSIIKSTCGVSISLSELKAMTACVSGQSNCFYGPRTITEIVTIRCCTDKILNDCLYHISCPEEVKKLNVCVKGELEFNCLYMNCDPESIRGIPDVKYHCCAGASDIDCTTLDNCVQAAPCKINKVYEISNPLSKHPVNDYSTFTGNCFQPRPCCISTDPPDPADCNINEVTNDQAIIMNSILVQALNNYNSIISENISENIKYDSTGKVIGYYFEIGKSIKILKEENKVHKCVATDFKKQYSCCNENDPEITTNCHKLTNCIKPKKCMVDIFGNDYVFPGNPDMINPKTEDPRNCYKPRPCCSAGFNNPDFCEKDPLKCITVAYPCCGTGPVGKEVYTSCHSLPNCIFPKPCCSSGNYFLKRSSGTPESYPPECNNLPNCFPAKPCCNVNINTAVDPNNATKGNKYIIRRFDIKCPFGSPITQYENLCESNWQSDRFPPNCRHNYGADPSLTDELFTIRKTNVLRTICQSYTSCNSCEDCNTCTCEGCNAEQNKMCKNCCSYNKGFLNSDVGEVPSCIITLSCCADEVSSNCHNLKNCHGYYNKDTKKTSKIKCWTDNTKPEEANRLYQRIINKDHPYCEKGKPCCRNPPLELRSLDPKIYQCDDTMSLVNNLYDPDSYSNCTKTKPCCSPDYKDVYPDRVGYDCSWDFNCFPIAYPKNNPGQIYFKILPSYYSQSHLVKVLPKFYLEDVPKENAYIALPCCEPGKDSTILKPCSIDARFCIPEMPCCSNDLYSKNPDLYTNKSGSYGCVEKSVFFNCRDVSPKCIKDFYWTKECTELYNTWNPVPCVLTRYEESNPNKVTDDLTYETSVWQSPTNPDLNCITRLPCCTPRYTVNCHNIIGDSTTNKEGENSFCYEENYKCVEGKYEKAYLRPSATQIYTCSIHPNAIEPIPCCTPELQSNCIKTSSFRFILTEEYGCIPPMPCCDLKGENLKPCHNLKNCQPPKPCCLFNQNAPSVLGPSIPSLEGCVGCKLGKFTEQNDVCCLQKEEESGCTRNKELTLEYFLCQENFPNLSIRPEGLSGCLTQLPCCSQVDGVFIPNVPENCKNSDCNDNNRYCCDFSNNAPGCKADQPCLNYKPYCSYYDEPLIKSTKSCSIVDNCMTLPKPCCKRFKFPSGCTKNVAETLANTTLFPNKPCCINNNLNNGPDGCVIKGSSPCKDIFPCCENNKLEKPKGCVVADNESSPKNCLKFKPLCTPPAEEPEFCEEDKFECLPILPCCTEGKVEENCVSEKLKTHIIGTDYETKYPDYPYCMKKGPKCSLIYQMPDCSTFPNAYNTIPCCEEGKEFACSDDTVDEVCIIPYPCCADDQIDRSNCHNLVNCIPPLPACKPNFYMIGYKISGGCSEYSNAWPSIPCCDRDLPYDIRLGDSKCKRKVNDLTQCIPRVLPCCYLDSSGHQIVKNGLDPLINCHNLENCIKGKPICDCIGARYLRSDCTFDTSVPNFTAIPCCGEFSNQLGKTLTLIDGNCAQPPEPCVSSLVLKSNGNPYICCPTDNPFTFALTQCTDQTVIDAKKADCDNLLNCLKPGPLCKPGKYMIRQSYPTLWGGRVSPCINDENAGYEPYLCDDRLKRETDSEFLDRCLPKLPCCLVIDHPPSNYPCHNLIGCIPQNDWCCTKDFNLNCVNLDLDDQGNVKSGVSDPKFVYCKPPVPCCNGKIPRTLCVEPNITDNNNNFEKVIPTNCIPEAPCCSNFVNQSFQNEVICHELLNCKKDEDEYYLQLNKITVSSLVTNTTVSKAEGIDQRPNYNYYETLVKNEDNLDDSRLNPQNVLDDIKRKHSNSIYSFGDYNYGSNGDEDKAKIDDLTRIINDDTKQFNTNIEQESNENLFIDNFTNEKITGNISSGTLPFENDPSKIDVLGETSQPEPSQAPKESERAKLIDENNKSKNNIKSS